jgi:hypothetical protein
LPKINVYQLKRPERRIETRTFEENETTFTLTLQEPDAADLSRIGEEADRLLEDYVTGNEDRPAAPFPVDGIKLSKTLLLNAAAIAECQTDTDLIDRYQSEEFIAISAAMPETWLKLQRWVNDLSKKWQSDPGK